MTELRNYRIKHLKRKQNGKSLLPHLLAKLEGGGFNEILSFLIDQEQSYDLFKIFNQVSNDSKKYIELRDASSLQILDAIKSFHWDDWSNEGFLFFRNFLDVGAFRANIKLVSENIFDLCQKIDGDSIYFLDSKLKHGFYFDYSENNVDQNNCFDLEIW